jgi:cellulose 1,4-beta-cellobiosidase
VTAVGSSGESGNSNQVSATPSGGAAPGAPTNLTATAGNQQVALGWSASSGATSYRVKRGTASGGPYTTIASPTATSHTDTGVTNGITYYYVVTAVNTGGESGNSNQATAAPASSGGPLAGVYSGSITIRTPYQYSFSAGFTVRDGVVSQTTNGTDFTDVTRGSVSASGDIEFTRTVTNVTQFGTSVDTYRCTGSIAENYPNPGQRSFRGTFTGTLVSNRNVTTNVSGDWFAQWFSL